MAEITVPIVIEETLHKSIKELVQHIADEHKILVTDIGIEWYSPSVFGGGPQGISSITKIKIQTESR